MVVPCTWGGWNKRGEIAGLPLMVHPSLQKEPVGMGHPGSLQAENEPMQVPRHVFKV